MSEIKKVIRDGKVAVPYSPSFGAGRYTWGVPIEFVFDPELVALVEQGKHKEIAPLIEARNPNIYIGGSSDLEIEWIPQGAAFKITEYDGNESIEYKENDEWIIA